MGRGRLAPGLGAISLIVFTVVAGCGPDTAALDRDAAAAAPTTTTDDALSSPLPRPPPPATSASVAVRSQTVAPAPASTTGAAAAAAASPDPVPNATGPTPVPPALPDHGAGEPLASPSPLDSPSPLVPEVLVPDDAVSINTARVVINQSNVAVDTGGSANSSARSVVESDAAVLVVQGSASGIEVVSLEVRPGWVEAARSHTPERLTLRYVLGTTAVDMSVWANGGGLSSSVSSSSDR